MPSRPSRNDVHHLGGSLSNHRGNWMRSGAIRGNPGESWLLRLAVISARRVTMELGGMCQMSYPARLNSSATPTRSVAGDRPESRPILGERISASTREDYGGGSGGPSLLKSPIPTDRG